MKKKKFSFNAKQNGNENKIVGTSTYVCIFTRIFFTFIAKRQKIYISTLVEWNSFIDGRNIKSIVEKIFEFFIHVIFVDNASKNNIKMNEDVERKKEIINEEI